MVTKKDLKGFAEYCSSKFGLRIHGNVIEDYLKSLGSGFQTEKQDSTKNVQHELECGLNNARCSHIAFDSAKCNICPH